MAITPVNQSYTYNDAVGNLQEAIGLYEVAEDTPGAIGVRIIDPTDPDGNITEGAVSFWSETARYIGVSGNLLDAQPAFEVVGDTYVDGMGVARDTVTLVASVSGPAYQAQFASNRFSTRNSQKALVEVATVQSSAGYALDLTDHYVSFPANVPRVTDRGWFGEASATNLLTYSATLSNVAWTLTSAGLTGNQADLAYGASANLVTEVGTSGVMRRASTVAVVAATGYVLGMLLKRGNTDWVRFGVARETGLTNQSRAWFNLATGAVGSRNDSGTGCGGSAAGIIDLGDGWFYCYLVFTAPTTAVVPFIMTATADASTTRTNNGSYYNWNNQLELGSVPSSPIVTTSTAVTRIADVRKLKLGASPVDVTITYDDATTASLVAQIGDYTLTNGAKYIASAISTDKAAKTWALPDFLVEGLDNAGGMLAWLRYLKASIWPSQAGTFEHGQDVSLYENALPAITLTGTDGEFVATHAAHSGAMFEIGTPNRTGGRVVVDGGDDEDNPGLSFRLNRAGTRTSDEDHVRLRGMLSYDVQGLGIPSADNNGLLIGREQGGVTDYVPEYVTIAHCNFGGRVADGTHGYGTIGDTIIALWTPGLVTRVEYNLGTMSGDDFIFIGHTSTATALDTLVQFNEGEIVAQGISTSVAAQKFRDNYIRSTLNFGIGFITDSILGSTYAGHGGESTRNVVEEAGFFTAAAAGASSTIPQVTPYAFWFRGNNIVSTDDVVRRCKDRALVLQPPSGTTQSGVVVEGMTIEQAGCSDAAGTLANWVSGKGVIHRASGNLGLETVARLGSASKPIRVNGSRQSLVEWFMASGQTGNDTDNILHFEVENYDPGSNPIVATNAQNSGARIFLIVNVTVLDRNSGNPYPNLKSVLGSAALAADVTVNVTYAG